MKADLLTWPCDVEPLATLHASGFSEAWSADWIGKLMVQPGTFAFLLVGGFVLIRVAGDEAEVLTLVVDPAARRRGIASTLVRMAAGHAQKQGARRLFLEVADANEPAKSLYTCIGFREVARRQGYYRGGDGAPQDALVLTVELPLDPMGKATRFD